MTTPSYRVDTSPLIVVLYYRLRRIVALITALGLFFYFISSGELPEGLSYSGYNSLCVLALAVFLWSTNIIPSGVTGILVMVLVSTFVRLGGGMSGYQMFGSVPLFFLLGSFILSASLRQTGLSNRLAINFLAYFARSPLSLFSIIYLLSIVFSYFMISHGVAAVLLPIVLEILLVIHLSEGVKTDVDSDPDSIIDRNKMMDLVENRNLPVDSSSFSKMILLALSFGCALGGMGSILGSGRVSIALEYLDAELGKPTNFSEWSLIALPMVFCCSVATFAFLYFRYPIKVTNFDATLRRIRVMQKNLGGPGISEILLSLIVLLTVVALAGFTDQTWTVASIMLLSATLIFVLNLVSWPDLQRTIDWGIIFMFGGAIVLGTAVSNSKAAGWLVNTMGSALELDGAVLIVFFLFAGLVLSQILSNSAVFAAFLPVTATLVGEGVLPGVGVTEFTVALSGVLGFAAALPISSPTAALVFSTGYFRRLEMFWPGMIFATLCFIVFLIVYNFFWPFWKNLVL